MATSDRIKDAITVICRGCTIYQDINYAQFCTYFSGLVDQPLPEHLVCVCACVSMSTCVVPGGFVPRQAHHRLQNSTRLVGRPRMSPRLGVAPRCSYPDPLPHTPPVFSGKGPGVNQSCLKTVLSSAFQQRRKMLRQSLKPLLRAGQTLPEEFATKRPEHVRRKEGTRVIYRYIYTWRYITSAGIFLILFFYLFFLSRFCFR